MNKYLETLAFSTFLMSNAVIASQINEITHENETDIHHQYNFRIHSNSNSISDDSDDSFEDEEQKKRFEDNKEQMKLNSKLADKYLGLNNEGKRSRKK